jgi:hypothetical protein
LKLVRDVLTLGHINPLDVPPVTFTVNIFEIVFDIGGPSDVCTSNINCIVLGTRHSLLQCVFVSENALGDEAARNGLTFRIQGLLADTYLLMVPQVLVQPNRLAIEQIRLFLEVVSSQLSVTPRLYILPVVLVEVA